MPLQKPRSVWAGVQVQVSSAAQVSETTREDPALGGKSQSFVLQGDGRAWLCQGQQFLWRKEEPLSTGQSLHVCPLGQRVGMGADL